MSEARNFPAAGSHPARGGGAAPHAGRATRWRDIRCVEFEPEAPPPAPQETPPAIGDSGERHGAQAPERDPGPRYGRAIAPLPRHLIASVTAQPRVSGSPAPIRHSAPTSGLGTRAVLRGTPFPGRARRGGRRIGWVTVAVVGAALGVVAYHGDQIFAGLAKMPQHPASAAPLTAEVAQTTAMLVPPLVAEAPAAAPAAKPATTSLAAASVAPPLLPAPPPVAPERIDRLQTRAKAGDAAAQYTLAVLYARGQGVPRDYKLAASWFREAAIAGNAAAQYNLGVLYERGLGLGKNMSEALIWYHSAAAKNYPAAEYNLALSYADGRGAPQDLIAADRWYRRAARQGVVAAMVNLAIQCESAAGDDCAPVTAYAWYKAAGGRGDDVAAKRADELFTKFSSDDRKAAEAAAAQVAASIHSPAPETPVPPPAAPDTGASGKAAADRPAAAQASG